MDRITSYIQQQQEAVDAVGGGTPSTGLIIADDISFEQFKGIVKKWLEIDSYIKKAQDLIKEKKKQRNKLSEAITKFMCKYDIEDLNTKEGRIRCKTTYVKKPISQKEAIQKIEDLLPSNGKEIVNKIYEERPKQEKTSLRRLKIS
jgi:seryl-tRNA synthetase